MGVKFDPLLGQLTFQGSSSAGGNPVNGPATSTDNAVPRFDGTTGNILQDSSVIIDDSDNITTPGELTIEGTRNVGDELDDHESRLDTVEATLPLKQDLSEKGMALGYAPLDASAKVPLANLPNAILIYRGVWNAATNTPTLADGVGTASSVYRVSVAGTQDLGSGPISFEIGDYAILSDTLIWEKADTTDAVSSVNGQIGVVVLEGDDIVLSVNYLAVAGVVTIGDAIETAIGKLVANLAAEIADRIAGDNTNATNLTNHLNDTEDAHDASAISYDNTISGLLSEEAQGAIDELKAFRDDQELRLQAAENDIDDLQTDVVDHETRIDTLESTVADHETRLDAAELEIDDHETRIDAIEANYSVKSADDKTETLFTLSNNTPATNITGFSFAIAGAFEALVHIAVDDGTLAGRRSVVKLYGLRHQASWEMSQDYLGDNETLVTLSITNAGQLQVAVGNIPGFVSGTLRFRAISLS